MLIPGEWLTLAVIEEQGLSKAVVLGYVEIGFVEASSLQGEICIRRDDLARLVRAERIRCDLGANLIGAALVVEVLERFSA